jgi:hypothetical protein
VGQKGEFVRTGTIEGGDAGQVRVVPLVPFAAHNPRDLGGFHVAGR